MPGFLTTRFAELAADSCGHGGRMNKEGRDDGGPRALEDLVHVRGEALKAV